MVDSKTQVACEDWVRKEWLPQKFGQAFRRAAVPLAVGGMHSFDAVSADGSIVAVISTSNARTAKGRRAIGKMNKLRSDLYFLHKAAPVRGLVVVTEHDMYERCVADQAAGLIPEGVEIIVATLPAPLATKLRASREASGGLAAKRQGRRGVRSA